MARNDHRSLSLEVGDALQLRQQPRFAAPYMLFLMAFAQLHRRDLEAQLCHLPEHWSFEDRLLGHLIPALQADIAHYYRSNQHDLGDLFDARQLRQVDMELVHRVLQILHRAWGLAGEQASVSSWGPSETSILQELENSGIFAKSTQGSPPELNVSSNESRADARVTLEDGTVRVILRCHKKSRLGTWTTYRKLKLHHLLVATFQQQLGFLDSGPEYLRAFTLSEAAKHVRMHESTASRLAAGISIETPYGTYSLDYFFPQDVQARGIQAALLKLIESEDRTRPLTDQEISLKLRLRGFAIARRTVAKYRAIKNIPSASERKAGRT